MMKKKRTFPAALSVTFVIAGGCVTTCFAESLAAARPDDPVSECRPIAQLPLGVAQTQTMRLNVTCVATPEQPSGSCRVTLKFVDAEGVPVLREGASAPLELTRDVPVRGVASLDLDGRSFVTGPALRRVVRPVVVFDVKDFLSDRLVMNVELFDTGSGRADIRYAFEPCRTLPFALVPAAQRPDRPPSMNRELSFAPPGITGEETVNLNVICNPDPERPRSPCQVVLRYSPYETATRGHAAGAVPLAEQELSIQPGAIGSFEVPGFVLGATLGRLMFRPSVVGSARTLGRLVTGLEILDPATGIARSLYQPPNKRGPIVLR